MADNRLTRTEEKKNTKNNKSSKHKQTKRTPLHGLVLLQEENLSSSSRDSQCLYGLW